MKYCVCAVFDRAVGAFSQPFFSRARNEAIRSFETAVRDEKLQFNRNREDYVLMYLFEWDDNSGAVVAPLAPEKLLGAFEIVEQ